MNFVGVDLHKQTIVMCVANQARRVLQTQRLACCDPGAIRDWFAGIGPFQVAVEATASYEWFVRLVEPLADRVVLVHPGKLRVIAESTCKTDKIDAKILATFLALDMLPEAYRPTPRQREHRVWVRHRQHLRSRITATQVRLRRIFSNYNADRSDLFTAAGRKASASIAVSSADRFAVEQLWKELDVFEEQMAELIQALRQFAQQAAPAEAQARRLLRTIPGVGEITTEVYLAEVADVRRFRSQKKVVAYAGLAPGLRESAGKRRDVGITHTGSRLLRWVLCQAAWQLVRRDPRWRGIFEGLAKRRGRKKAITAVARRLLCVMTSLVMNGQEYRIAA
jgi:transposase